jgi:mono/diheme cytochrome c family protein
MRSDLVKALSISAAGAALVAGLILAPAVAQDMLPPGPGMEETLKGCGGCHGVGQIMTEHRSAEEWANTVTMMITNGAPVSEAEFDKVVGYLATYFGTNPPPAAGAAPVAPAPAALAPAAPAAAAPVAPAAATPAPAEAAPVTPTPAQ